MYEEFGEFADVISKMKGAVDQSKPLNIGKSKSGKLLVRRGETTILKLHKEQALSLARNILDLFGE